MATLVVGVLACFLVALATALADQSQETMIRQPTVAGVIVSHRG